MNYTLHQLKVFLEVVSQGSVTRAAEEMHMSQPALSIQLRNFQQQFDIPLTEVIGKKLYITEFGHSIAEIAGNIMREAETLNYKTHEFRGMLTGRLRISSASTGKYVIPYFLSGFLDQFRSIDLVLDVTHRSSVIDSLKRNKIDFALVSVLPPGMEVLEEKILPNPLYLIGSSSEPDEPRPFILREEGSATRAIMDKTHTLKPGDKRLELTTSDAIKQAVLAGLGYSVLPLIGVSHELRNEQLFILKDPAFPVLNYWRLIWLREKKLSPVAEKYLDYLRERKSDIRERSFGWMSEFIRE